jgi:hypothetical protein
MQLHDCVHEAKAKAHPRSASALVRTIKPAAHKVALVFRNAWPGIAYANDRFLAAAMQTQFDAATLGGEFHRVVYEVGNRLEQEIAVAVHDHVLFRLHREGDPLVFGNGLVKLANLTQHIRQMNVTKRVEAAAVLDFSNAQERCDDRQ